MNTKGFIDLWVAITVSVSVAAGCAYMVFSDRIDSPAEEFFEQILEDQGIDVDFSEYKKLNEPDNNA